MYRNDILFIRQFIHFFNKYLLKFANMNFKRHFI